MNNRERDRDVKEEKHFGGGRKLIHWVSTGMILRARQKDHLHLALNFGEPTDVVGCTF